VNVDIRLPIGGMFSIIGLILVVFGLWTVPDQAMYVRCLGINVNLLWGVVMLAFGLVMLRFGRRAARRSSDGEGGKK
jgi:hypothetical protein